MKPRTSLRFMGRGLRGFALAVLVDPVGMATLFARRPARGKAWPPAMPRYIRMMDSDATVFEAVIVPHRSLSSRGLAVLMAVLGLICAVIVLSFWLIGAWPVAGFGVVELGLAVFLLRLNASRARASELVLLSERALRIIRTDRHGRREERVLPVGWLNAVIEDLPGRCRG
ncbi:MAG: DUF2244 domain-containing protein [Acetobacteraceae bacterium]